MRLITKVVHHRKKSISFSSTAALAMALAVGLILAPLLASGGGQAQAQRHAFIADNGGAGNDSHKVPKLRETPYFITYWGHDATGYHPAIILCLEGDDNADMSGLPVQLQVQFRVLAEGLLTVGRATVVFPREFRNKQLITPPIMGKRAFELELNKNDWPNIECKVLAKVGDAADDDVQSLFPVPPKVFPEAMSDEDASTHLSMTVGSVVPGKSKPKASVPAQKQPNANAPVFRPAPDEKPLVAVAATLGAAIPKAVTKLQEGFEQYFQKSNLPGLGDDFYMFEKTLGLPVDTENRDKGWVWAAYRKHPQVKLFVGSRGDNGKADVIVAAIDTDSDLSDSQFSSICRDLASKFRNEKMANPEHSVRYTPGGRVELTNIAAQSYRAVYFTTRDSDQNKLAIVAVSRQPGSLSEFLKDKGQKTALLHFLLKGLGADGSN